MAFVIPLLFLCFNLFRSAYKRSRTTNSKGAKDVTWSATNPSHLPPTRATASGSNGVESLGAKIDQTRLPRIRLLDTIHPTT